MIKFPCKLWELCSVCIGIGNTQGTEIVNFAVLLQKYATHTHTFKVLNKAEAGG